MNIPYHNMEIEQIYTQLLSNPRASIAICAAEQGEGVTSLAFALAQRNLLAGHSTLLVDLNLYRPSIKSLLTFQADPTTFAGQTNKHSKRSLLGLPQLVCSEQNSAVLNGVIAPNKRQHIMKLRQPGVLEQCIEEWLEEYDTVIIDTSPLNRINAQNIPPERIAAACDGAILCVLAGRTPEAAIDNAMVKLNSTQAQLLGCVFNDRDNPTLKQELLREVDRIKPMLNFISRPLRNMINKSRLLALEV
ncbi:protein SypD [Psychromonas sp. psych-6C06]|uniref:protein SypD n=1 Tax=Psychromonas sp. psych-6C06 TaxID=2058089 RepID=UPI000C34B0C6|nr:protein SypD [Psychromonas sp. psych-6C06]PKF62495.1 protein SypD [Psychromonas sp. psych-6C06]